MIAVERVASTLRPVRTAGNSARAFAKQTTPTVREGVRPVVGGSLREVPRNRPARVPLPGVPHESSGAITHREHPSGEHSRRTHRDPDRSFGDPRAPPTRHRRALRPGLDPDRHADRALRGQGRQRDPGGLHPPVRAALLPALGHRRGRHLGARRHRLPGRLRDRRQHRHRARHDQCAVGHPDRRGDHLRHRVPAGLLRRPVQHRPRPDHPRLRLRLLRLGADERHLRDVHLHLLRPRGLDHGAGPATRARHPAVARLRGVHPDGDPAGHLRDEGAGQAAGLDHPAVAGAVRHPDGLPADQPPGLGGDVLRLPGRGRRRRTQLRRR